MVNWTDVINGWQLFANWYFSLPLLGQVMVIIGIFAAIALVLILIFYIIYGLCYLVYYIFKGIYYLFKYIALGIYKIFEALYYALSGKEKPIKAPNGAVQPTPVIVQKVPQTQHVHAPIDRNIQYVNSGVMFCTECGNHFTESMSKQMNENGMAFCVYCGKGFKLTSMGIES